MWTKASASSTNPSARCATSGDALQRARSCVVHGRSRLPQRNAPRLVNRTRRNVVRTRSTFRAHKSPSGDAIWFDPARPGIPRIFYFDRASDHWPSEVSALADVSFGRRSRIFILVAGRTCTQDKAPRRCLRRPVRCHLGGILAIYRDVLSQPAQNVYWLLGQPRQKDKRRTAADRMMCHVSLEKDKGQT
jgi:hypothetical protein